VTALEDALLAIAALLEDRGIPYMVIGGMANAVWGVPRATLDIDVTIRVAEEAIEATVDHLRGGFSIRVDDPATFVRRTRVLPLQSPAGVAVDVIFGLLPFEEEAIRRAAAVRVGAGAVRFCTAEDLVLMKIISDRQKDLDDVREILRVRAGRLDDAYLEPRVRELAHLLERPEILERYREQA